VADLNPTSPIRDRPTYRLGLGLGWLLLCSLVLFAYLGSIGGRALIDPDEGRNAEVAREMAFGGDLVVPHLNALPYLDKPVLYFAATALSLRVLGANELAARLPSLLFSLATAALVIAFGWRRFGTATGLVAGSVFVTTPLVLVYSGVVIFEAPLMFWVTAATLAFHQALERGQRGWCVLGWAAAGLAVLTKGPVGLLLPLLINLGAAVALRRPIRVLFRPVGIGVFVLLVSPWFLAVSLRHPEFPHYALVRETLERVATDSMRRTGPILYFLPILVGGTFPWVVVLLAGGRRLLGFWRRRTADEVLLLSWVFLPTLFFSLSQSKRPGYILPVVPAVALLVARLIAVSPGSLRVALWAIGPLVVVLGLGLLLVSEPLASRLIDAPTLAEQLRLSGPWLGIGLLIISTLTLAGLGRPRAGLAGLALLPLFMLLGGNGIIDAFAERRSARELAQAILEATPGPPRVVGVGAFAPSLAFYLGDTLILASHGATELKSNYIREYRSGLSRAPGSTLKSPGWAIAALDRCAPGTVFLFRAGSAYEAERAAVVERLPLLYRDHRYAAYGPCVAGSG
jgi:4-amino-4-deoxy-L-arabinose transferase-like glycosyltransferase